jgi:hypothetical protein
VAGQRQSTFALRRQHVTVPARDRDAPFSVQRQLRSTLEHGRLDADCQRFADGLNQAISKKANAH